MRRKYTLIVVSVVSAMAAVVAVVSAGDPASPPGPPETTFSYTLEDIYDRLDTGAAGTPITFTEPSSGPPTGTMHTLDEIYDLIGKRAPVPKTGRPTVTMTMEHWEPAPVGLRIVQQARTVAWRWAWPGLPARVSSRVPQAW